MESKELNTSENLRKFVKENYDKIPIFKALTQEEIETFVETGKVSQKKWDDEHGLGRIVWVIEKRGTISDEYEVIAGLTPGIDEYGEYETQLSTQMSFNDDGEFRGYIYGDNISFKINDSGNTEMQFENEMQGKIYDAITKNKEIVTHFGDDLDNKSSIYAIQYWMTRNGLLANNEEITISRVPAGQVKEGALNVDTGGHKGNRLDNDTIVIDGDLANGVKSAAESLNNLGIYVPDQIIELVDTMSNKVSPLDSSSGLALVRYLTGKQAFKLAEDELLDKTLTDEQIKLYGLEDAHKKQQEIIDNAVEKIKRYTTELPNGEKIVLAPEKIQAGSLIAYEMEINYYASFAEHMDGERKFDGVTFAITSKPGVKLPEEVLKFGQALAEKYRIDDNSSGVLVNPNGQMIVAGGFKNPGFKIKNETINSMLNKVKDVFLGNEKGYTKV